jgi:hypothetical protein
MLDLTRSNVNPPAAVRPAEDLCELTAAVRAELAAESEAAERSVEHARRAGEGLKKVRDALLPKHAWTAWLGQQKISARRARERIQIADNWSRIPATVAGSGVRGVLAFLRTAKTGEEGEDEVAPVKSDVTSDFDPTALPRMRVGHVYILHGTDASGGAAFAELTPRPDCPDCYVIAFIFEDAGHVDYCCRGMRLLTRGWEQHIDQMGFFPGRNGWEESPFNPDAPPLAVALDLTDRSQRVGRYAWYAMLAPEEAERAARAAATRWGLTEAQAAAACAAWPDSRSATKEEPR